MQLEAWHILAKSYGKQNMACFSKGGLITHCSELITKENNSYQSFFCIEDCVLLADIFLNSR